MNGAIWFGVGAAAAWWYLSRHDCACKGAPADELGASAPRMPRLWGDATAATAAAPSFDEDLDDERCATC